MRHCKGCPDRLLCAQEHYRDGEVDCKHIKALHKEVAAMLPARGAPVPAEPAPMTLLEACDIVLRHWELYRERGFDASMALLERVVNQTRR